LKSTFSSFVLKISTLALHILVGLHANFVERNGVYHSRMSSCVAAMFSFVVNVIAYICMMCFVLFRLMICCVLVGLGYWWHVAVVCWCWCN